MTEPNGTNGKKFRIVRITGNGDMKILAETSSREVANVWIDGYTAGGGLTRKGKSDEAPKIEVWSVGDCSSAS